MHTLTLVINTCELNAYKGAEYSKYNLTPSIVIVMNDPDSGSTVTSSFATHPPHICPHVQ
ncbi:MAG: hypothetical protein MJ233_01405 [Mycoplasmoidaceae bacterium]|nr:hypothetical protein [Mycoplasmoidaceae bacterium]